MTPIPILLYHSVAPATTPEYEPWCVHPDRFAEQLAMIVDVGFTPMTISQLVDATANDELPPRPIAVTFDDGRADFSEFAIPALTKHEVASTMYVVTERIGQTSSWLTMPSQADEPMMSWDDVRTASKAGVEIGSHSATHRELDVISTHDLHDEIAASRSRLSDELGGPVRSFAYPHGYHSVNVVKAAREAGYDSACAVKDTWSSAGDDRFALSRMFVFGTTTTDELRSTLLDPPYRPMRERRFLRRGWRCVRWVRHRVPTSATR